MLKLWSLWPEVKFWKIIMRWMGMFFSRKMSVSVMDDKWITGGKLFDI